MKCLVCDGPEAELHFGAMSCRACAAFFRRFFHSKKLVIECTCPIRNETSHPCRYCRIQKCLSIGMMSNKVQQTRDKHSWKCSNGKLISTDMFSPLVSRTFPRDTLHLTWTIDSWDAYESKRTSYYSQCKMNIFQVTGHVDYEMDAMWRLVCTIFPQITELSAHDKNALLANFIPIWWHMGPIMGYSRQRSRLEARKYQENILSFYDGAFRNGKEMSWKQILEIFEPYYWYYHFKVILAIVNKQFDVTEFVAIVWMAFFDSGHSNISEDCAKICRTIRDMVLRQLRSYQIDKNYDDKRIVDVIETLPIVERAVEKFEEELLVCELNNIEIHEDFTQVMKLRRL